MSTRVKKANAVKIEPHQIEYLNKMIQRYESALVGPREYYLTFDAETNELTVDIFVQPVPAVDKIDLNIVVTKDDSIISHDNLCDAIETIVPDRAPPEVQEKRKRVAGLFNELRTLCESQNRDLH